jgi:hypothetical protein
MEKLDFGTVAIAIVDFTFHVMIGNLPRKKRFYDVLNLGQNDVLN